MSKRDKAQGMTIPWEVADQITLASLKNHRDYLKSELKQWRKNPKTDTNPEGYWLHPDDVVNNEHLINHMNVIINYYGD